MYVYIYIYGPAAQDLPLTVKSHEIVRFVCSSLLITTLLLGETWDAEHRIPKQIKSENWFQNPSTIAKQV